MSYHNIHNVYLHVQRFHYPKDIVEGEIFFNPTKYIQIQYIQSLFLKH